MASLLEQLKQPSERKKPGTLLDELRAETKEVGEISSPLLPRPTLPSPLEARREPTIEELKTMELEGLAAPGAVPSPFVGPPVPGAAAVPVDIAEALLHLGKGIAGVIPVGLESLAKMSGALLGGASIDEALAEAEKAGAWLGPGPTTPAAQVIGGIAALPHEAAMAELPEDIMARWAAAHGERIRAAKREAGRPIREPLIPRDVMQQVDVATKTIFSTAIELGLYKAIGDVLRTVMPEGKPRPNVQDVKDAATKLETRLRKGGYRLPPERLTPEARALADDIMREMGIERPKEPEVIYKKPEPKPEVAEPEIIGEVPAILPEVPARSSQAAIEKIITEPTPTEPKPLPSGKPRPVEVSKEVVPEPKPEPIKAPERAPVEKKVVTMDEVHAEAERIVSEAKDLNEVHKGIQELSTRYENNLDTGFADAFELNRYREWGDEILGRINETRKKAGLIEEPPPEPIPPEETLGFGGTGEFQKMYEKFIARYKDTAAKQKKPITPEAQEVLGRGEIVSQRRIRGRLRPPIYRVELDILKETKKIDQTWFHRGFENPHRTFEEAGGQPLLDLTTHPYHAREAAVIKLQESLKKSRGELLGKLTRNERKRVTIHAIASQKNGGRLLTASGIKDVPKLTPKELEVYNALRARYESWYTRLSRMRESIGKEPFPKTDDYFTFLRNFTLMERAGFRPIDMPTDILDAQFTKMGATPFKFARPRRRAIYKLELDPFRILEIYENVAARHIQMSPLIAKLRELQSGIKDPETGATFRLVNENPVLAAALHSWTNHIAGMKSPTFRLPPVIEGAMMRVNSNLAASVLGANIRSAMIQVSALRNTVAEIGYTHTMKGVLGLLDPKTRGFHGRSSKVLKTRVYDVTVEDALRNVRAGRIGEVKKGIARAALKPLQILDYESAMATRIGAYDFALNKLKYSKKRAAIYADDVVTKTQASALPGDIAPIQRSVAGKFLTLFQTFTINDWDFLVKDVVGVKRGGPFTKKTFVKAMRYVTATTLFNILMEDVLHIQSPFPTPIRAFRESLDRGDDLPALIWNVGKEFIEPIPLIGAARYGKGPGGPGFELLWETVKFIRQDPMARPWWELSGKWLGVVGTAQTGKMIRAAKRGESLYGQFVGTYTPPEPAIKKIKRPKGLRSP